MDSTCIGELVSGLARVRKNGGTLHLANLTPRVERLLTMVRLMSVFQTFRSVQEAVLSLRESEPSRGRFLGGLLPESLVGGSSVLLADRGTVLADLVRKRKNDT